MEPHLGECLSDVVALAVGEPSSNQSALGENKNKKEESYVYIFVHPNMHGAEVTHDQEEAKATVKGAAVNT